MNYLVQPNEDENANDRAHYTAEASTDKNSKADYATDLPFKTKYQPRNPFKYDSSDSDEEDEEKVMQDNKQSSENNKPFFGLWSETFFVQDKDTRFKEAKEFFMNYNSDDEKETDFTKRRRYLKKIIRWKSKNSAKNDKLFKSKLGGQSTKVKRKNVTWKVRKFQKKR